MDPISMPVDQSGRRIDPSVLNARPVPSGAPLVDPVMEERAGQAIAESKVLTAPAINYRTETNARLIDIRSVLNDNKKMLKELYDNAPLSDAMLAALKAQMKNVTSKVTKITETLTNRATRRRSARTTFAVGR